MKKFRSHGTGNFEISEFKSIGDNVIIENGVLVFHPENIEIGNNVYIGHQTILKGYYKGIMKIGDGTWIGQQCFIHSAGNVIIGCNVGIGPGVRIISSFHKLQNIDIPILNSELEFQEVYIGDDSDIGIGAIILPGVRIGKGVQIGAGSVVTKNIDDYCIAVGVPAKIIKNRKNL